MSLFSLILVVAQFVLIALIVSPTTALFGTSTNALIGLLFIGSSFFLALWAVGTIKLANFSVLPEPVKGGSLSTSGPYRFIRHPMYSAVIAACLGASISHGALFNWIWLACLCAVLAIKIRREEDFLQRRYQAYAAYKQKTHAIIPYIY